MADNATIIENIQNDLVRDEIPYDDLGTLKKILTTWIVLYYILMSEV